MKGLLIAGPADGPPDGPPEGVVAGLPKPARFKPANSKMLFNYLSRKLLIRCCTRSRPGLATVAQLRGHKGGEPNTMAGGKVCCGSCQRIEVSSCEQQRPYLFESFPSKGLGGAYCSTQAGGDQSWWQCHPYCCQPLAAAPRCPYLPAVQHTSRLADLNSRSHRKQIGQLHTTLGPYLGQQLRIDCCMFWGSGSSCDDSGDLSRLARWRNLNCRLHTPTHFDRLHHLQATLTECKGKHMYSKSRF